MTKEEMKVYATKYKKIQKKLSTGLAVFIFLISLVLFAASIALAFYIDGNYFIAIAVGVMFLLGVADLYIGVRFLKYSKYKFDRMPDKEAAEHYCKIHGFDSKMN